MTPIQYTFALEAMEKLINKINTDQDAWRARHLDAYKSPYQWAFWRILTALRGPDNANDFVKTHTTRVIRQWLLGEYHPLYKPIVTYNQVIGLTNSHFARHLLDAEKAIQLLDPTFKIFKPDLEESPDGSFEYRVPRSQLPQEKE